MASRDLGKLIEPFQSSVRELIKQAKAQGIPVLVTETTRTLAEQKENVRKGVSRTLNSKHLTGEAVDIAFTINSKLSYDANLYKRLYETAKPIPYIIWPHIDLGWEKAGFTDKPHFQFDPSKKPTMSCEQERAEIVSLNNEIGRVTHERDATRAAFDMEQKGHKETLEKYTNEQKLLEIERQSLRDLKKKYEQLKENKFEGMTLYEKFTTLFS